MTIKKTFAFICFYCLLIPAIFGQNHDPSSDSTKIPAGFIQSFENQEADSIGGTLKVPNVFTPNGDALNDYFQVSTDGTTVYEFTIYTKTGTRIFHSTSTRVFWDGKSIGGKDLPEGIYYYVIEEKGGSDPSNATGFLHLFR